MLKNDEIKKRMNDFKEKYNYYNNLLKIQKISNYLNKLEKICNVSNFNGLKHKILLLIQNQNNRSPKAAKSIVLPLNIKDNIKSPNSKITFVSLIQNNKILRILVSYINKHTIPHSYLQTIPNKISKRLTPSYCGQIIMDLRNTLLPNQTLQAPTNFKHIKSITSNYTKRLMEAIHMYLIDKKSSKDCEKRYSVKSLPRYAHNKYVLKFYNKYMQSHYM